MKQVLLNAHSNVPTATEVPDSQVQPGYVLIANRASIISPGTERTGLELQRASLAAKARKRPDLVRQVITKVYTEGLPSTIRKVRSRLGEPFTPGYSCAGIITEIGSGVDGFSVGDRVAGAGFGHASHAELVSVPKNLTAKLPPEVSFAEGACGTLGAIALHGVRTTGATLGETVLVVGLGLVGQLTAQILQAGGIRVIAVEPNKFRAEIGRKCGIAPVCPPGNATRQKVLGLTAGRGADAIIITAASASTSLVTDYAEMARDRGTITIIGDVPLHLSRRIFYEKELKLRVSRSYGPGRYDREYEENGGDYPLSYVRWTEQRNMESFLELIAKKQVNVKDLITYRVEIEQAEQAYQLLDGSDSDRHLAILLEYPRQNRRPVTTITLRQKKHASVRPAGLGVGFVGLGEFASGVLLPAVKSCRHVRLTGVAARGGVRAYSAGKRGGFAFATTDHRRVVDDPQTDLVIVATTHNSHVDLTVDALAAGKAVFVEKPLATTPDDLARIVRAFRTYGGLVQVGFNRRYSPASQKIKDILGQRNGPLSLDYRICAGPAPSRHKHWIADPTIGGGRLIGEVCHFIDTAIFLTDTLPRQVSAHKLPGDENDDSVILTLELQDGSVAQIRYLTQAGPGTPKEKIDIVGGGITATIDDFREYRWSAVSGRGKKRGRQNKGHKEQLRALISTLANTGMVAGDFVAAAYATQTTFAARQSLQTGMSVPVSVEF